jgi:hypothetical protein
VLTARAVVLSAGMDTLQRAEAKARKKYDGICNYFGNSDS